MIAKYIVHNETHGILMALRPYQFYAAEAIFAQVKDTRSGGYIWHTTGSGKTLTSFKTAQLLMDLPKIYKIVFVVDRRDLDYQTAREFNAFVKGSVDSTTSTKVLVDQLTALNDENNSKLIVTTIQKLNTAISNARFEEEMLGIQDKRLVFIFDECHRSQFGETHQRIEKFFTNAQMFGFTGTPIFEKNASRNDLGKRGTGELFGKCLHKYVITHAISDENVLKFAVDYVGRYQEKEGKNSHIDIEVEAIDTAELMSSPARLEKIVDYIIAHHDAKTQNRKFTAMMCVSSVKTLIAYYDLFQAKRVAGVHDLNIATIFSYNANEADASADGRYYPNPDQQKDQLQDVVVEATLEEESVDDSARVDSHSRDKLESYIADYNARYGTKFTTKDGKSFYQYYNDISKRAKGYEKAEFDIRQRVDIILVVNIFLTGFDAKKVNTLYVDKNLRFHGLIQAFSRTNRIMGIEKSQGNIVSFRNLKSATDEAVALFANIGAKDTILLSPYEDYVARFNQSVDELLALVPQVSDVDKLLKEDDQLLFVQIMRALNRNYNVLKSFSDFSWQDLSISEQQYRDYLSKYLDLYQRVRHDSSADKVSIIDDVDFELELMHRDDINVSYILGLLTKLYDDDELTEDNIKQVMDILGSEPTLRSKRKLIRQFIDEQLLQGNTKKTSQDEASDNQEHAIAALKTTHLGSTEFVGVSSPEQSYIAESQHSDIADTFRLFIDEHKWQRFYELCAELDVNQDKFADIVANYRFTNKLPLHQHVINALCNKPKLLERRQKIDEVLIAIQEFAEQYD